MNLAWVRLAAGLASGLWIALLVASGSAARAESDSSAQAKWYRGATHVHTLWSDGDAAPEMVAAWYRDRGYHFVALSDHDALQEGEWWFPIGGGSPLSEAAVREIADRFGASWPELEDGGRAMRLKTHAELAAELEVVGEFVLLPASEITTGGGNPHVVALNLREAIQGVAVRPDQARVLRGYLERLRAQAAENRVPMLGMVAHLNWGDGLPARRLLDVEGLRLFEVYNGSDERGEGWPEKSRPKVERIWDIVLSLRLLQDPAFRLYGVANDDAHQYALWGAEYANPGRGWVAVRAMSLTPEALIHSMRRGEFYSSTGVELADVSASEDAFEVRIRAAPGARYTTEFIGTLRGFDAGSQPVAGSDGEPLPGATRRYGPEIGRLLLTTRENPAVYQFQGDELYVRARVRSDVAQENPLHEGDLETAWTQPVHPAHRIAGPGTPGATPSVPATPAAPAAR